MTLTISHILEACSNGPYQTQIHFGDEWGCLADNIDHYMTALRQCRHRAFSGWPWRILDSKGNVIASGPATGPLRKLA